MNCANHPEIEATAFCRQCGKPMCRECQKPAQGSIYCAEHAPADSSAFVPPQAPPMPQPPRSPQEGQGFGARGTAGAPPSYERASSSYTAPSAYNNAPNPYAAAPVPPRIEAGSGHPVLALILGFIPGVGAIYNGQYAKGLIHVVVFGLLISVLSNGHSAFEPLFGILLAGWVFYMAFEAFHTARKKRHGIAVEEFSSLLDVRPGQGRFPGGALLLIALGFVLLLTTTDLISMEEVERYWPVGLIALGLFLLYARLSPSDGSERVDRNAEARK